MFDCIYQVTEDKGVWWSLTGSIVADVDIMYTQIIITIGEIYGLNTTSPKYI